MLQRYETTHLLNTWQESSLLSTLRKQEGEGSVETTMYCIKVFCHPEGDMKNQRSRRMKIINLIFFINLVLTYVIKWFIECGQAWVRLWSVLKLQSTDCCMFLWTKPPLRGQNSTLSQIWCIYLSCRNPAGWILPVKQETGKLKDIKYDRMSLVVFTWL